MMKALVLTVPLLALYCANADYASAAECKSRTKVVNGPKRTIIACLDGKWTTCMRDSQRAGWTKEHAYTFCDRKRAEGRVK